MPCRSNSAASGSKRIAVGEATIRAGEAELAATIAQVRNDVRRAYFAVLVPTPGCGCCVELRDLAQRARDTAQARFDAGDAPRLEVLQADLALGAAAERGRRRRGRWRAARARLNALLGQPLDTVAALSTRSSPARPSSPARRSIWRAPAAPSCALLDRRIDEQRAQARARATRCGRPTSFRRPRSRTTPQPEFTYGWRAGVAVTLPLFTTPQGRRRSRAGDARPAHRRAAGRRCAHRRRCHRRGRRRRGRSGWPTSAIATSILPQAQQVEQLAQDSYQLGQTGIAALLQALQAARDLRLRSLDAVAQFQGALADLERAIGAPLP